MHETSHVHGENSVTDPKHETLTSPQVENVVQGKEKYLQETLFIVENHLDEDERPLMKVEKKRSREKRIKRKSM
jgi:hypothetical protein